MADELQLLRDELSKEKKKVDVLQKELLMFEQNGVAKLYFALNRKAWEMADILNKTNLADLKLDDSKDKTFERIRFIINDSSGISTTIKVIGEATGITGDEKNDVAKKPFIDTLAIKRN